MSPTIRYAQADLIRKQEKRIEELENAYDYVNNKSLKRLERIEELEAALRHLLSAQIPGCPKCAHAKALLDTEAKP